MNPDFEQILHDIWGYDSFRSIQKDIIESIYEGHDTLGLMPTGGGKSLTFQVPAMAKEGLCLVITPLIALMKDQVAHLRRKGIKADAIHSGKGRAEIVATLDNCILGHYKFLYVSPERLSTDLFLNKVKRMGVSFICVDEAHCISQWGYDFRPSYLTISDIRRTLPDVPILALTATATPLVVKDIQEQLAFRADSRVFRMSFERKNLAYSVEYEEDKLRGVLRNLTYHPGTAIVYTRSRRQCREFCEHLNLSGISATYYHAGLNAKERDKRQKAWQNDEIRVMVATNAFGMGIDKPDVRLVVHIEMPDSIEAYYQEAGRAGRDGQPAYAVLLYAPGDRKTLLMRIAQTYPEPKMIRDIYEHLCFYYSLAMGDGEGMTREFDLAEFSISFKHFPVYVHNALKILEQAQYIEYREDEESKSRLRFTVHRDQLYEATKNDNEAYNQVVQALLRNYTGIFADDIYIDEEFVAQESHQPPNNVFLMLKSLARRRIIHYIPRKRTAYICFTQRRIDKKDIVLDKALYKKRKKLYDKRIHAVINYAEQTDKCRSRYLLEYFDDHSGHDCQLCDVCQYDANHYPTKQEREEVAKAIIDYIRERGPLFPQDLKLDHINHYHFLAVLQYLVDEELVHLTTDGLFYVKE